MLDFATERRSTAMANLVDPVVFLEMRRAARRLRKSREDAHDLVQDTFVEAIKNLEAYDATRGTTLAWLKCIARTRNIDHFRRERARASMQASLAVMNDFCCEQEPYSERLHDDALVQAAMASLPSEQHRALWLLHYDGLTTRQVAERTNASVGTVKTRLRLGREKLGRLLQDLR